MGLKISKPDKAKQDNSILIISYHCQKYAGFDRLACSSLLQMPHLSQRQTEFTWISSITQKDKEATRLHMAQTPNEHIPIQQGWSVSVGQILPGRWTFCLPLLIMRNSLASSITVPVTQSAVTYRQKLIQQQSPINCVHKHVKFCFQSESSVSAAPTTLFSSLTLIQMF